MWKALSKGETIFKKGIKWIPSKNSLLSLWHDKWLSDGPIRSLTAGPFQRNEDTILLRDITQNNFWNLGCLSFVLPLSLGQKIKATPIPMSATGVDKISWSSSPNGEFELKEAYKLACTTHYNPHCDHFMGNWIWKISALSKIKCFLWQCFHQSIQTREVLNMRGLNIPPCCPLCNADVESIIHTLRDCRHAWDFWNSFPLQFSPICFMAQIYWFGCGLTVLLIFIPLWASLGALSLLLVCGVCGLDVTIFLQESAQQKDCYGWNNC